MKIQDVQNSTTFASIKNIIMKRYIILLWLALGFTYAANAIPITDTRIMSPFNALSNECALDISYIPSNEYKVFINMDEQYARKLVTEVQNGMLRIYMDGNAVKMDDDKYVVIVYAPVLVEVHNTGSGDVELANLTLTNLTLENSGSGDIELTMARYQQSDAPRTLTIRNRGAGDVECECFVSQLSVENEGSGDVDLKGTTTELTITCIGAGDVEADELTAERAVITAKGTAKVVATVTGLAKVSKSGTSDIRILGDAQVVPQ